MSVDGKTIGAVAGLPIGEMEPFVPAEDAGLTFRGADRFVWAGAHGADMPGSPSFGERRAVDLPSTWQLTSDAAGRRRDHFQKAIAEILHAKYDGGRGAMAKRAGIEIEKLDRYLAGETPETKEEVMRLAFRLEVPTECLLGACLADRANVVEAKRAYNVKWGDGAKRLSRMLRIAAAEKGDLRMSGGRMRLVPQIDQRIRTIIYLNASLMRFGALTMEAVFNYLKSSLIMDEQTVNHAIAGYLEEVTKLEEMSGRIRPDGAFITSVMEAYGEDALHLPEDEFGDRVQHLGARVFHLAEDVSDVRRSTVSEGYDAAELSSVVRRILWKMKNGRRARVVMGLYGIPNGDERNGRQIAQEFGVSHTTVGNQQSAALKYFGKPPIAGWLRVYHSDDPPPEYAKKIKPPPLPFDPGFYPEDDAVGITSGSRITMGSPSLSALDYIAQYAQNMLRLNDAFKPARAGQIMEKLTVILGEGDSLMRHLLPFHRAVQRFHRELKDMPDMRGKGSAWFFLHADLSAKKRIPLGCTKLRTGLIPGGKSLCCRITRSDLLSIYWNYVIQSVDRARGMMAGGRDLGNEPEADLLGEMDWLTEFTNRAEFLAMRSKAEEFEGLSGAIGRRAYRIVPHTSSLHKNAGGIAQYRPALPHAIGGSVAGYVARIEALLKEAESISTTNTKLVYSGRQKERALEIALALQRVLGNGHFVAREFEKFSVEVDRFYASVEMLTSWAHRDIGLGHATRRKVLHADFAASEQVPEALNERLDIIRYHNKIGGTETLCCSLPVKSVHGLSCQIIRDILEYLKRAFDPDRASQDNHFDRDLIDEMAWITSFMSRAEMIGHSPYSRSEMVSSFDGRQMRLTSEGSPSTGVLHPCSWNGRMYGGVSIYPVDILTPNYTPAMLAIPKLFV